MIFFFVTFSLFADPGDPLIVSGCPRPDSNGEYLESAAKSRMYFGYATSRCSCYVKVGTPGDAIIVYNNSGENIITSIGFVDNQPCSSTDGIGPFTSLKGVMGDICDNNLFTINKSGGTGCQFNVKPTGSAPIPTLTQWSLIILGLFLSALGVVAIKSNKFKDYIINDIP